MLSLLCQTSQPALRTRPLLLSPLRRPCSTSHSPLQASGSPLIPLLSAKCTASTPAHVSKSKTSSYLLIDCFKLLLEILGSSSFLLVLLRVQRVAQCLTFLLIEGKIALELSVLIHEKSH